MSYAIIESEVAPEDECVAKEDHVHHAWESVTPLWRSEEQRPVRVSIWCGSFDATLDFRRSFIYMCLASSNESLPPLCFSGDRNNTTSAEHRLSTPTESTFQDRSALQAAVGSPGTN